MPNAQINTNWNFDINLFDVFRKTDKKAHLHLQYTLKDCFNFYNISESEVIKTIKWNVFRLALNPVHE